MSFNETQVKNLRLLLSAMEPGAMTKEEFLEQWKKAVEVIKKIEDRNLKAIADIEALYRRLEAKLSGDNENSLKGLKADFGRELNALRQESRRMDEAIKARLAEVRDGLPGKDADEEVIVEKALSRIRIPDIAEIAQDLPKLGTSIRNALELLQGEERLALSAVDGLEDKLEQLEKARSGSAMAGGLRPAPTGVETPAGTINGTNKEFTVTFTPQWITLNGQNMYESNGYALSSTAGILKITLDNAPVSGDVLRSHY
jgi:DNA gyrase/topoisomerase IV subunit A